MKKDSVKAKRLKEADLIIIDEASGMKKDALRCIDQFLKELMKTDKLFGGKTILLGGDFRQTLPIVEHGNAADILGNCLTNFSLFKDNFQTLSLKQNMRAVTESLQFKEWLLNIGEGKCNTRVLQGYSEYTDPEFVIIPDNLLC